MPKLQPGQVPKYRLHRQSGQAIVTLSGKDYLLGAHESAPSRREYARLIGEWLANQGAPPAKLSSDAPPITVARVVAHFWRHARTYYSAPDGKIAAEAHHYRNALRPLIRLYGQTPAAQVGPLALKAVRETMVTMGWSRPFINAQVNRIRRVFKWAVAEELVPPSVHQALTTVTALVRGRTPARETEPVKPVDEEILRRTLEYCSPTIRAMIDLQLLTGARPGEICGLRGDDITRSDPKLWTYRPPHHKTAHHGHDRVLYLGARCQDLLRPFLLKCRGGFVFSPATAEADRRAELNAARTTPAGQGNRPGTNRARAPRRSPGERYTVEAYRRAIARACEVAFQMPDELHEPRTKELLARDTMNAKQERSNARAKWRAANVWHPHQLRHNAATTLRAKYGLEAAQVILGHKTLSMTEIYAEKNVAAARSIMAQIG